jgi:hypothetical protein
VKQQIQQLVDKSSYKIVLVAFIFTAVVFGSVIYSSQTFRIPTTSHTATISYTPIDYVCVRVISDYNETPIEGVEFNCSPETVQNGTTTVTTILLNVKTNSSGWACVQWTHSDIMLFRTEYQGKTYNFTVPMFLGENYAVLNLPLGKVTTTSYALKSVKTSKTAMQPTLK